MQVSVHEHDVDGGTETLDDLDFEDGALQRRDVHEVVGHALLRELDEQHEQVGDTLAGVSRSRHERDVFREVLVVVVRDGVEPLLGKGDDRLVQAVLELALDRALLLRERLPETAVLHRLPAVQSIDLVEGDDERRLALAEETDRLERLRFEAVLQGVQTVSKERQGPKANAQNETHHDVDDKDSNVTQRRSTLTQVGERLVTRRVDNEQTRELVLFEVVLMKNESVTLPPCRARRKEDPYISKNAGPLLDRIHREVGRADLLSDTARFALLHVGLSDLVEQLGLARVDVTHDDTNR